MPPRRRDFDDKSFDFEALLSERTARNDASLSSWAESAPTGRPPVGAGFDAYPSTAVPPVQAWEQARPRTGSRGQPLSWFTLALSIAFSVLMGFSAYAALNSIGVPIGSSLAAARHWVDIAVFGLVGVLVAILLSIIALFRARPRLVATLALVVCLILPVICLLIGVKAGAEAFTTHAAAMAHDLGLEPLDYLIQLLTARGIDAGPWVSILERFFG